MSTYYSNLRSDVIELLPDRPFRRILEIGGGEFGTLQTLMGKFEAEGWGVDVYQSDAPLFKLIVGSITDPQIAEQLPEAHFDLVVANDVLEHVADTDLFLDVITKALKPGAVLALSVPNARQIRLAYEIFVRGRFPRHDAGLFDVTHLRWFCRSDVRSIVAKHGYTLLDYRSDGRFVPRVLGRTFVAEFLALHNLFIFQKV